MVTRREEIVCVFFLVLTIDLEDVCLGCLPFRLISWSVLPVGCGVLHHRTVGESMSWIPGLPWATH